MEQVTTDALLDVKFIVDNLWILISTFLVFIMHLGFASLESGLTQSKNTVNILFKNTLIPAIGLLTYAYWGFNLMYPGFAEGSSGWFGFAGFGLDPGEGGLTKDYADYTYWADFIFQGMFAATAATIVSGAVAERIKLVPFLLFSVFFVGIVYPWAGSWHWGGGWLQMRETTFYDFAGSTLVHSVGGWGALAGIIVLGPRKGKYVNGITRAIPGHSMPLAAIGVFLLWFGWYGFNGGSVLSADPGLVSLVFVTTSLAAAAGAIGAFATSALISGGKHDLSMSLNGILAGLVGITAGADQMSYNEAVIIGLICGAVVVGSVIMFDKLKLDDPVGALSVHLVCGILGTLFLGIFGELAGMDQLVTQIIGILAYGAICFPLAFAFFYLVKLTVGLRVDDEEEAGGLDYAEHGMKAYIID